ncbi:MAG: hypothetical protein K940chlam3_01573, partial [Chlamydiae bacterium]|nr:hypothetical protein [Chlamydiota bacterium]
MLFLLTVNEFVKLFVNFIQMNLYLFC